MEIVTVAGVAVICLFDCFPKLFHGEYFENQRWMDKEKHAEVIWRKALVGDGLYPRKV